MARHAPLWLQSQSYPAALDRRLIGAIWPNGGVSGMAATVQAASMNVQVAFGAAVVPDLANPGAAFLCTSDATETVTLATLAAGNDRIDLITVQQRGGANDDWIVHVVQGTPAPNPVAPAVPAGQTAIAQVRVVGGQPTLTAGNLVDRRAGLFSGVPSATGTVTVTFSNYTGSNYVTATFPPGRFTAPPLVFTNDVTGGGFGANASSITATGCQIRAWTVNNYSGTVTVQWFAIAAH